MTLPYTRERHLAEQAVLRASILTKRVQSTVGEISKDDRSPVTIADFAAQALIIRALRDAFPNDGFLGEEDSAVLRANRTLSTKVYELVSSAKDVLDFDSQCFLPKPESVDEMLDCIDLGGRGKGGDNGRFWIMDPIDGTAAFLKGQQYAVSLALIENGKEAVGVLGCPNIGPEMTRVSEHSIDTDGAGIMLTAVRGQGSTIRTMTYNGLEEATRLSILEPLTMNKLHLIDCPTDKACRHDVVSQLGHDFQALSPNTDILSLHIRYAALIVGGADAHFCVPVSPAAKMHIWDHAGSNLIFTELGGKVTDLDGKPIDFGAGRDLNRNRGLVAARGAIHKTLLISMKKLLLLEGDEQKEKKNVGSVPICV